MTDGDDYDRLRRDFEKRQSRAEEHEQKWREAVEYRNELIGRALMKLLPVYEGTDNMETAELLDRMALAIASSEAEGEHNG